MPKTVDQILKQVLVSRGLISEDALGNILKEVSSTKGTLISVLIRKDLVTKKVILEVLSQELNLPGVDLKHFSIEKEALKAIPSRIAFYYKCMPLKLKNGILTIAVAYPLGIKTEDEVRTNLGYEIETVLALEGDLSEALKKHYGLGADTLEKIDRSGIGEKAVTVQEEIENIEELAEDASVIKLVNQIIFEAYKKRATDIHIEPYRGEVSIRYRTDGILYDANIPGDIKQFIPAIISRIKIMCNLNIVEKRLPQDGRAIVKTQDQTLDLRISTLPTPYGESLVIRILPSKMLFNLEKLGFNKQDLATMEDLISRPYGIIFITGPTGSGKTTTLYAALSKLNTRNRKIVTIEDPIEYELKGITQIQVASEIGLDFARGLRSILRHDPDMIMVGEVRDLETAEIAIRVALTGHLVFSTLHTKDAASGVARLIDIGIEPYLVASSIEAFIAQRLIRVICPQCKREDKDLPHELRERIAKDLGLSLYDDMKLFKGNGCDNCNFTGYVGRTGVYEILLMNETIRSLVLNRVPSEEIKRIALESGMFTLKQDGWQKATKGITTPGEVMRVASKDEVKLRNEGSSPSSSREAVEPFLETRMYPRLNTQVNLRYHIIKSKDELVKKGYSWEKFSITKNISAGGIAFVIAELIPVGSIVEINIELPDGGSPVSCLAKVLWVREVEANKRYETGICFLDLTGSERARINSFVVEEVGS